METPEQALGPEIYQMKRDLNVVGLSEATYQKMTKKKLLDSFADRTWADWFKFLFQEIPVTVSPHEYIQLGTRKGLFELWIQNLVMNVTGTTVENGLKVNMHKGIWAGKTIADLVPKECLEADKRGLDPNFALGPAVVLGRGPSIYHHKHLERLAEYQKNGKYQGIVVAADGALIDALKRGVRVDYSVSIDGHRELIKKWYEGDLVKEHAHEIKPIIGATCAPNVAEICEKQGLDYYWCIPIYDDYHTLDSFTIMNTMITKSEKNPLGVPSLNVGGNSGCCAWIMSYNLLRRSPVALLGIDLGYRHDTKHEDTIYWKTILDNCKGDVELAKAQFRRTYNPGFQQEGLLDPTFEYYRHGWISLEKDAGDWHRCYNCTEGGNLWFDRRGPEDNFGCLTFEQFVQRFGQL